MLFSGQRGRRREHPGGTDGSGTVLRTNHYDPYGEGVLPVLTSASTLPASTAGTDAASRYLYGAKEWDGNLSLYDFSARWYNPAGAVSFTTMDPLCEKYYSLSPYAYCAGNPVNLVDPFGLEGTKYVEEDGTMIIESNVLVLIKNEIPFSDDMTERQKRKVEKKNKQIRERNAFRLNSITNALNSEFGNTTDEDGNVVKFLFNVIPLQVEDTSPQYSNVIDLSIEYGLPAETPDRLGKGSGVAAASVFAEGSTSHLGEAIGGIEVRLSSYSSQTIAHEMGHTLKLSHPKERGGNFGLMHYPPERLASEEVSRIIRMAYAKRN